MPRAVNNILVPLYIPQSPVLARWLSAGTRVCSAAVGRWYRNGEYSFLNLDWQKSTHFWYLDFLRISFERLSIWPTISDGQVTDACCSWCSWCAGVAASTGLFYTTSSRPRMSSCERTAWSRYNERRACRVARLDIDPWQYIDCYKYNIMRQNHVRQIERWTVAHTPVPLVGSDGRLHIKQWNYVVLVGEAD